MRGSTTASKHSAAGFVGPADGAAAYKECRRIPSMDKSWSKDGEVWACGRSAVLQLGQQMVNDDGEKVIVTQLHDEIQPPYYTVQTASGQTMTATHTQLHPISTPAPATDHWPEVKHAQTNVPPVDPRGGGCDKFVAKRGSGALAHRCAICGLHMDRHSVVGALLNF